MNDYVVSWFSAGVSSAVATKLICDEIDEIIYIHIDDHHPDTLRFVDDCESWFGKPIKRLQAEEKTTEQVFRRKQFINSPFWAPCTQALKKDLRFQWEKKNRDKFPFTYVWGFDFSEERRAESTLKAMPEYNHRFPLIEKRMKKKEAHRILKASKIKRPKMYELGYQNNNCVGCVKGGKSYWNRIRVDFPDVFAARAKLEREIGATCINGVYLDELDPNDGKGKKPICDDCGILCELRALK